MFRTIFGFDWRKSSAHWLFLTMFIEAQGVTEFTKDNSWSKALTETPKDAIKRLMKEGLLQNAELSHLVASRFSSTELKEMLKAKGLPVSGKKEDLARRLSEVDPDRLRKMTIGIELYVCSKEGCILAEEYRVAERQKQTHVVTQTISLIKKGKYKEACTTMAACDSAQVFPKGVAKDWPRYNPIEDAQLLSHIIQASPSFLARFDINSLNTIRIIYAMSSIWGIDLGKEWSASIEAPGKLSGETAIRMLSFYIHHQKELEQYRRSNVVIGVEIMSAGDACPACRKLNGKKFGLNAAPELPNANCTHEKGCRCAYGPITKSFKEILGGR